MTVEMIQRSQRVDLDQDVLGALRRQDPAATSGVVRVRLLPDAWMWTWEICDPRGEVSDSGWTSEWAAYDTAEEAYHAGRQRLTRRGRPPADER